MSAARIVLRNTAALSLGQLSARLLGVVYVAALARHVRAEGMGQLATAQSLTAVAFLFVNLGLDVLATREVARDRRRSSAFLANVAAIKLILSSCAVLALVVLARVGGYQPLTQRIILVYSLVMATNAVISAVRATFQAFERLELDAAIQLGRDVINIGLSLAALWLGAGLLVVVWISVFANLMQLVAGLLVGFRIRAIAPALPSPAAASAIFKQGLPFGLVTLISALYPQTLPILLSLLAGATVTGQYWAANSLLSVMLIAPGMYAQAVFPLFARLHLMNTEQLRAGYQDSFRVLTFLGLPLALGAAVLAGPLAELLFGPGFTDAANALRVIGLTLCFSGNFASAPALQAMGRQGTLALGNGMALAAMALLGILWVPAMGAVGAGLAYLAPCAAGFLFYTVLCHRLLRLPFPAGMLVRTSAAAAGMALVVRAGLGAGLPLVVLAGLVGPVSYLIASYVLGGLVPQDWLLVKRVIFAR